MTEHYTSNTEQATSYCKKCQHFTQHRVDSGRIGPCLEHFEIPRAIIPPLVLPPDEQGNLFERPAVAMASLREPGEEG